jgi:uncharacterized protein (DUF2126 family)
VVILGHVRTIAQQSRTPAGHPIDPGNSLGPSSPSSGSRPVAMLAWLGLVTTAGAYLLLPAAWLGCRLAPLAL